MASTITYYRTPDGYAGLTDQSPRGFQGLVFVGRGPKISGDPDSIEEQGFVPSKEWVKIPADQVPDEWFDAIGYGARDESRGPIAQRIQWIREGERLFDIAWLDFPWLYAIPPLALVLVLILEILSRYF
jgi:hypothetical protein